MLNYFLRLAKKLSEAIKKNRYGRQRRKAESQFRLFSNRRSPLVSGTVLLDAGWDNPNFWLRYSILRAALNLNETEEVGLLGRYRRREQLGTLKRLGIKRYYDISKIREVGNRNYKLTVQLCRGTTEGRDILTWSLPLNFPADILYDHILKLQKSAWLDVKDQKFFDQVRSFLHHLSIFEDIMEQEKPSLVISSHPVGIYATLVWAALSRGIPVLIPFGDSGVMRFWLLSGLDEIYDFMDRPKFADLSKLSIGQPEALLAVGERVLERRINGRTDNLGAVLAYASQKVTVDKQSICRQFDWDPGKPIIGVYTHNWFDYPHTLGMKNFDNFYDWVTSTLKAASGCLDFNWIFKGHPADEWYGGIQLADLIDPEQFPHIKLASKAWSGKSMIEALNAFVTYHGTVGIEATACGKPVLVSDVGWYHDWGFVKVPKSRRHYLETLTQRWWEDMDMEANSRLAQIFAGWYWGKPSWQGGFLLEDDSKQWEIYKSIPALLGNNAGVIARETELIREWFVSGYPHYHAYKMMVNCFDMQ